MSSSCLDGSLHGEMVLQIVGECVVYGSIQKGLFNSYMLDIVAIPEPFWKMVLDSTKKGPSTGTSLTS